MFDFGKGADLEAICNLCLILGSGLTLRLYVIYVGFWEGADLEAICNLCWIFNTMFKNHVTCLTVQ